MDCPKCSADVEFHGLDWYCPACGAYGHVQPWMMGDLAEPKAPKMNKCDAPEREEEEDAA